MNQTATHQTATLAWFARHELTLFWRDWISMMTAGKRTRERMISVGLAIFAIALHGLAYAMLSPVFNAPGAVDATATPVLVMITGSAILTFFMMLSQTLESVTRAFYARADLDLILSSPASSRHIFAIRIITITLTTTAMICMLAAPFINVASMIDGPKWLSAYLVVAAFAALATSISILITIGLFRLIGPKRTRLIAQIIAAVVGASFLIGIQIAAIVSYGTMSRLSVFSSQAVISAAPNLDAILWLPARAIMGEISAVIIIAASCFATLAAVIHLSSAGFAGHFTAASSIGDHKTGQQVANRQFVQRSTRQVLRAKEWTLLKRDPWLVSQTLMQILYLVPPAVLLWQKIGDDMSAFVVLAPVVVMAVGQLAGGLSWLAISGEDAPDLIATAPIPPNAVLIAKIEAVLSVVAVVAAPLLLLMAILVPWVALCTALGIAAASASAIAIQMWFAVQAKRSQFRRRQVSSRAATFAEAFSSILWAGAACLAAAGSWFGALFAGLAVIVLGLAWLISPRGEI